MHVPVESHFNFRGSSCWYSLGLRGFLVIIVPLDFTCKFSFYGSFVIFYKEFINRLGQSLKYIE